VYPLFCAHARQITRCMHLIGWWLALKLAEHAQLIIFCPVSWKKVGTIHENVSFCSVYNGELQLCMYLLCRDVPDPDTGIQYPVKFRHPALSGIRYKFAGYLPDSNVRYFVTTMKRKRLILGVYKLWNTNNYWACTALRRNYNIFFGDGDVKCLFANSSEFYILNTSKHCKVNHKIWPW
jgi:hypothetical protein